MISHPNSLHHKTLETSKTFTNYYDTRTNIKPMDIGQQTIQQLKTSKKKFKNHLSPQQRDTQQLIFKQPRQAGGTILSFRDTNKNISSSRNEKMALASS